MNNSQKIVNPKTGRKVNINSRIGKNIISEYTFKYMVGGTDDILNDEQPSNSAYNIDRIKKDKEAWDLLSSEGKCYYCRNAAMYELDQKCPSIKKSITDEINRILKQISVVQEGEKIHVKNKDYDNAKKSLLEVIRLINQCIDLNERLPDNDKVKIPDIPKIPDTLAKINNLQKQQKQQKQQNN